MQNAETLKKAYIVGLEAVRVTNAKAATKFLLKRYALEDGKAKTLKRIYNFVLSLMGVVVTIRDKVVTILGKRADKKIEVSKVAHNNAAADRDTAEQYLNELK